MRLRLLFLLLIVLIIPLPSDAQADVAHIVYATTDGGLSIITYQDGAFATPRPLLPPTNPPPSDYRMAPAPAGNRLAIIRLTDKPDLVVMDINTDQLLLQQPLVPPDFPNPPPTEPGDPAAELWQAIVELAWSPDGSQLAFVAGHDRSSADLHVFDTASNTVQPLETEPGAAALPTWSPNGKWLVYSDLQTFRGEAGFLSNGIFALGADGWASRLDLPAAYPNDVIRVGWRDADTLLISPRSFIAGARGLYSWHIPSQTVTNHLPETLELTVPVYVPRSDIAAFIVPDLGPNIPLAAGFYLLPLTSPEPILLFPGAFYRVSVINDIFFQLAGPTGDLLINATTLEETVLFGGEIATFVSPDARTVVAYTADSINLSSIDGATRAIVPVTDALVPTWVDDTHFVTQGTLGDTTGLVAIDATTGDVSMLDSSMSGSWAIVAGNSD